MNKKLPTWYNNYGLMINEQNSGESFTKLKSYLENTEILKTLVNIVNSIENYEEVSLDLNPTVHNIESGEDIVVEKRLGDEQPKIIVGIESEVAMIGNLNMSTAAVIVKEALEGIGTDEDSFSAVFAAIHKSAMDRNVKVQPILNALSREYKKLTGESLKDAIEGDFSGRSEVLALTTAGIEVEESIMRGLNPMTILGDVALMFVPVVGWGKVGSKFITSASRASTNIGSAINKSKRLKNLSKMSKPLGKIKLPLKGTITKAWTKLDDLSKIKAIKKAGYTPGGKEFTWITGKGNKIPAKVSKFDRVNGKVILEFPKGKIKYKDIGLNKFLNTVDVQTAANISKSAGIVEKATLAAIVNADAANIEQLSTSDKNFLEIGSEALGWYDSTTANPQEAYENYKNSSVDKLSNELRELAKGWTSDTEELMISLIIMSMERDSAIKLMKSFENTWNEDFYEYVIGDELESDMESIVGMYWSALVNEGKYISQVEEMLQRITKID